MISLVKKLTNKKQDNPLKVDIETIYKSGLFDVHHYLNSEPKINAPVDPVEHYITVGTKEGRNPHPLFFTKYYLEQCSRLKIELNGANPLLHFITGGAKLGLDPNLYFDTSYYLEKNPDVLSSGMNPLTHYIYCGVKEKRAPSRDFDSSFYLSHNPDIAQAGIEPLGHFLHHGIHEGRLPKSTIPKSIAEEYLELRQIEPLLPAWSTLESLPMYYLPKHDYASNAYSKLANIIDQRFSHLYILPEINNSDSVLAGSLFAKLIQNANNENKALIIVTDGSTQSLNNLYPSNSQIIYLDGLESNLTVNDKVNIIVRLSVQAAPKVIHNLNSKICWMAFKDYYRQLNSYTQLAVSTKSYNIDAEGFPSGNLIEFFNPCIDHVKWVFIDSKDFKNELIDRFALERHNREKLIVTNAQFFETNTLLPDYL